MREHLDSGALVAVVTATNAFVTGPIVREFGIPHVVATIPAQQNGAFTGKPRGTPAFKAGKIERVDAWLESLGLHLGSFEHSWFYSDSHNDLPLMQRVTDPVAVDPDDTLRAPGRRCRSAGWPVDLAALNIRDKRPPRHPRRRSGTGCRIRGLRSPPDATGAGKRRGEHAPVSRGAPQGRDRSPRLRDFTQSPLHGSPRSCSVRTFRSGYHCALMQARLLSR